MCKPNMRNVDRPCMKMYDPMIVRQWEEEAKQREFERRLKKAGERVRRQR